MVAPAGDVQRPGCLWHPVLGEHILAHGLTNYDPFGFRHSATYVPIYSWLADIALALLHRIAGPDTLLLAAATLLAAFYTMVGHRFLRAGCKPVLAGTLTFLAVAGSASHFLVRPHLFTLVFLGWTFALLVDTEAGRRTIRSSWPIVPMLVLWANLHTGQLAGVGTVILVLGGWLSAWAIGWPTPIKCRTDAFFAIAMGALAAVTPVLTPTALRQS